MEEEVKDAAELRQALNKRLPRGARLAGANLQGITLECVDLTKANLNHARLDRAVLRDAMLIEASVEKASARDADLRNADLERASFNQSDLTGSDLSETRNQSRESFVNSTLARVKGLSFDAGIDFESVRPAVQMGASNGVYAVAISPNGELSRRKRRRHDPALPDERRRAASLSRRALILCQVGGLRPGRPDTRQRER